MGYFTFISPLSVSARLTSLFQPRQQVFSIHNVRHQRTFHLLYIILLTILISIALPLIVLRVMSYNFIHSNLDTAFVYQTIDKSTNTPIAVVMAAIPKNIRETPANLVLATAILTFLLATIHLALTISSRRSTKPARLPPLIPFQTANPILQTRPILPILTSLLYTFLFLLLLISLNLLSTTHIFSSHFLATYVDSAASFLSNDTIWGAHDYVRYDIGTFDLETWACELKGVAGAVDVREDYGTQCLVERVARGIMMPFFMVLCGVTAVAGWEWVVMRREERNDEEKRGVVEESKLEESVETKTEVKHENKHEERIEVKADEKTEEDESDGAKTGEDGTVMQKNDVTTNITNVEKTT